MGPRDLSEQQLGSYRLVRMLGEGGMGLVYEAVHSSIGHRVAIKLLHERLTRDQDIVERFTNEAKAAALIHHPGIVTVFEFSLNERGQAFLVMEFLEGECLAARLERLGRLPVASALRIVRQAASALTAAHEKGIVHRDLKPENLFVVPDIECLGSERIKLLDFGIAKIVEQQTHGQQSLSRTKTGTVMGTPLYMSPEQCRGVKDLDGKADVYSLGAVLYQLLTGHPPFEAEGAGQVMAMHLRMEPPVLHAQDPAFEPRLSQLIVSMLAKRASERPTITEVATQLAALGAGTADEEVRRYSQRRTLRGKLSRFLAPGALVLALPLIAALLVQQHRLSKALVHERNQPRTAAPPRFRVETTPLGAAVYRLPDRVLVGHTPWNVPDLKAEKADSQLRPQQFQLKLSGYAESGVELGADGLATMRLALPSIGQTASPDDAARTKYPPVPNQADSPPLTTSSSAARRGTERLPDTSSKRKDAKESLRRQRISPTVPPSAGTKSHVDIPLLQ